MKIANGKANFDPLVNYSKTNEFVNVKEEIHDDPLLCENEEMEMEDYLSVETREEEQEHLDQSSTSQGRKQSVYKHRNAEEHEEWVKEKRELFDLAKEDVYKGMSFRQAALKHGVPRSTLQRVFNGKPFGNIGKAGKFTKEEELEIVQNLMNRSGNGLSLNYKLIREEINQLGIRIEASSDREIFRVDPGTGERTFINKTFFTHFVTRHNLRRFLEPGEGRKIGGLECDICFKKFLRETDLADHHKTIHLDFENNSC